MLKILFWNLNRKPLSEEIVGLATDYGVNILILAEDIVSAVDRLTALNRRTVNYFSTPTVCKRIKIYTSFSDRFITPKRESKYFTMREISLPTHESFTLLAVHNKSLLWRNSSSQDSTLIELSRMIREEEKDIGHSRTIVTGDFNADPFGEGMISSVGMHSMMCRTVASRGSRKVSPWGDSPFFYNPTWSLFGDEGNGPPGTYYRAGVEENCRFWHMFDQVLVRPAMIPFLPARSVEVPTTAGGLNLLDKSGRPKASDHLPLLFSINLPIVIK